MSPLEQAVLRWVRARRHSEEIGRRLRDDLSLILEWQEAYGENMDSEADLLAIGKKLEGE